MNGLVKICGITDASGMDAALQHGADMIGFVFREGSSRRISFEAAAQLAPKAKNRVRLAAVIVDADDAFIERLIAAVDPDILQLHGSETPRRTADIAARFGKPVIKALGIADAQDIGALNPYLQLCAHVLVEAKKSDGAPSGGSGRAFDWRLLSSFAKADRLLLAGGLNIDNVSEAIMASGAGGVDVSSGVENAPGQKDGAKISGFIMVARAAFAKQTQRISA